MKVYLAGRPDEHACIDKYATEFRNDGFEVVSTWHSDNAVAHLVEQFRSAHDSQAHLLAKFMRITIGCGIPGDEITNADRKAIASGLSVFDIEDAFQTFMSELMRADVVIADLRGAAMDAGYACALGKKLVVIGNWESPLIPFRIDTIKLATDWHHAHAIIENMRSLRAVKKNHSFAEKA
jgi:nucleoside 2-deoxyribosyltransferase